MTRQRHPHSEKRRPDGLCNAGVLARGGRAAACPWRARIPAGGNAAPPFFTAVRLLATLTLLTVLASCTTPRVSPFPDPIRPPLAQPEDQSAQPPGGDQDAAPASPYAPTPGVRITSTQAGGVDDSLGQSLQGPPIKAAFNSVPIPAFINEVFGTQLGFSYRMTPGLQGKKDLVTLRLANPVPPARFFTTARKVLEDYGITIREDQGMLTFEDTQEITSGEIPLLITGQTLPEVPATHRTIFHMVPLKVVRANFIISMLRNALPRDQLDTTEYSDRSSVLLRGNQQIIAQALALIEVLDQPLLRGKHGFIYVPTFISPDALSQAVRKVMEAQGYNIGGLTGNVVLLPFDDFNKLIVFAQSNAELSLVRQWIDAFDNTREVEVEDGLFTYEVKNTQVADMIETLTQLVGGSVPSSALRNDASTTGFGNAAGQPNAPGAASLSSIVRPAGSPLVVDERRNLLIFRGSSAEWAEILKVLEQLDRPVPSVLIEVVIAEISLTKEEGSGFEFIFKSSLGRFDVEGGTRDRLGLTTEGMSLSLNSAGQTRAALNFFYEDDKVVIRSQPKLLVKSGEEASITVGNEIPVVTQVSRDSIQVGGFTNVLQQVNYRSTGVNLSITPLVQAGGLVDIAIAGELSEARLSATTSREGTPTILNRAITTSLTLKDGGSLLMGGLISDNSSAGQKGIPGLARLPLFGRLFRNNTYQGDRTELIIMVTPYVIRDYEEGAALTEQIKSQLELHQQEIDD